MPKGNRHGYLVVITGPMYAGKSKMLLDYANGDVDDGVLPRIASKVFFGIPEIAKDDVIRDRHGRYHLAERLPVDGGKLPDGFETYLLDEVQFFGRWIVDEVLRVVCRGATVVVAGLDVDYRGVPFETTAELMAHADLVIKANEAVCSRCGAVARYSMRVSGSSERIDVDAEYVPVCRKCWGEDNGAGGVEEG